MGSLQDLKPVRPGGSSPTRLDLSGLEMWQEARQALAGSLVKMILLCKTFNFPEEFTHVSVRVC